MSPARDAQNPFFTLFHHPLPLSPRTNHFGDAASVCLATVYPDYHFCWDGMNNSVEILLFSFTTNSTQRMNNFEAGPVRRIPLYVSVSHFTFKKESSNNISLPGQAFMKLNTFEDCQIAVVVSPLDVRSWRVHVVSTQCFQYSPFFLSFCSPVHLVWLLSTLNRCFLCAFPTHVVFFRLA